MNQPEINTSVFNRLRFVLVETSRAGNIGAVARAMKTMGFDDLVLVRPRFADALADPEALAFASGAQDVLAGARIVGDISEALEGCNFAAAVSARLREFSPPVWSPRAFAAHIAGIGAGAPAAQGGLVTALIFGNERFGLPNQIVEQCNVLINIPANPAYSSLNLAQAAQVLAYECRVAAEHDAPETDADAPGVATPGVAAPGTVGFHGDAANLAQIDGMFAHLEQALVAIDFLDPAQPKKLMPRLKRLFARTQLETEEVNILRGIANQILKLAKR